MKCFWCFWQKHQANPQTGKWIRDFVLPALFTGPAMHIHMPKTHSWEGSCLLISYFFMLSLFSFGWKQKSWLLRWLQEIKRGVICFPAQNDHHRSNLWRGNCPDFTQDLSRRCLTFPSTFFFNIFFNLADIYRDFSGYLSISAALSATAIPFCATSEADKIIGTLASQQQYKEWLNIQMGVWGARDRWKMCLN